MDIGQQLIFFLAGLGVFNGVILALYFLFGVKPRKWVNILFGLLLLMLCIRIGKSIFHIFTDLDRIYRQIGLSACIMIGPLTYLYIKHFGAKTRTPQKADKLHLLAPFFVITIIGVIWPYEGFPAIWDYMVVKFIYGVWIAYIMASLWMIYPIFHRVFDSKGSVGDRWLVLVYSCVFVLCLTYVMAYYGFPYLTGPLLFSIIFYLLFAYLFPKEHRSIILGQEREKYHGQRLQQKKANSLLDRLSTLMEEQKVYLDSKIKLKDVADLISASPHEVSQVINSQLDLSFSQYLNSYRIKAACDLLKSADHLSIEGIGREVGFGSRSAFYTAFKQSMQQTPHQYKTKPVS